MGRPVQFIHNYVCCPPREIPYVNLQTCNTRKITIPSLVSGQKDCQKNTGSESAVRILFALLKFSVELSWVYKKEGKNTKLRYTYYWRISSLERDQLISLSKQTFLNKRTLPNYKNQAECKYFVCTFLPIFTVSVYVPLVAETLSIMG
jgi:hypothetical protein